MIIMGIDPGIATVGFGVVSYENTKFRFLDCGVIETPAGMRVEKRLSLLYDGMCELISKYSPDECSVEELFFNSNRKTVINVAQARGVLLLAAERHGIDIYEYTPLQVKNSVVGYGHAEKRQVMEMIKIMLDLPGIPKPDDAADALALAVCHAHAGASKLRRLDKLDMARRTGGR